MPRAIIQINEIPVIVYEKNENNHVSLRKTLYLFSDSYCGALLHNQIESVRETFSALTLNKLCFSSKGWNIRYYFRKPTSAPYSFRRTLYYNKRMFDYVISRVFCSWNSTKNKKYDVIRFTSVPLRVRAIFNTMYDGEVKQTTYNTVIQAVLKVKSFKVHNPEQLSILDTVLWLKKKG